MKVGCNWCDCCDESGGVPDDFQRLCGAQLSCDGEHGEIVANKGFRAHHAKWHAIQILRTQTKQSIITLSIPSRFAKYLISLSSTSSFPFDVMIVSIARSRQGRSTNLLVCVGSLHCLLTARCAAYITLRRSEDESRFRCSVTAGPTLVLTGRFTSPPCAHARACPLARGSRLNFKLKSPLRQ